MLEKNTEIVPCGVLLLTVIHETFIKMPLFQETSSAPKKSWLRTCKHLFTMILFDLFKPFNTFLGFLLSGFQYPISELARSLCFPADIYRRCKLNFGP